jgi:serine/threonine protein kinase
MIRVIRVCRKCGAKIFADAPEGLCGRCVLKAALGDFPDAVAGGGPSAVAAAKAGSAKADDAGHVDKPARATTKTARAAELLGELGDYELLEEVGRGGQGVVFRARQKSLNRTVALKVISLGQWASKAHLKRFRLEAEAAARLEHPGIVPIHEVGERDGSCYFSMKFVEGGQLDEVASRQLMPIRSAVELIAKVARTVHYAHEHGILHRDIKPGNILLDAKAEPHLTDFGLARLVETESTMTRTMEVLGTPSYMAPEQALGNNAAVSSVTDVYGLGAVLYQLLTGQPPFAGGTTYETIKLLLDTEPRPPRSLNSKVDRDLSTICLKCLEKDSERRYSSALALAEDLGRWLKHEPILARHTGIFSRGRKWVRRNPTTALLAASLAALTATAVWIVWKSEFISYPVTSGVAVLPFENLSGNPDNAYFSDGIQEEILTRLAKIAGLKVISRTSTQQYRNKTRNLREIARQLGVSNIVEGSVQKAADQVRVNVQLINAQSDSHLWADTYDRKLTDILGVESEIAKRIAQSLQAQLTGREEQALAVKPTNNAEAYDAYLRGLAFDGRVGTDFGLLHKVIDTYGRAVQLDPNFAVAWARLSRANTILYSSRNNPSNRDAAKRALEQAQKLDPDSPDSLLAVGFYQAMVLGDYRAAQTTVERVSEMLPGSSEAARARGLVARHAGHWEESVSYYERALSLDPRNVDLLTAAAWNYISVRQFSAALKLLDRVLDIAPNDLGAIESKVCVYQAEGNLDEAARLLSTHRHDFPPTLFSDEFRLERKYSEAIRLLQAQLAQSYSDEDKATTRVDLALTQRLAGDIVGAKITAEQARDTLERLYKGDPNDPFRTSPLSWDYALIAKTGLALKLAERAVMLKPLAKDAVLGPTWEEHLAGIQALIGENSQAISTVVHLLQTPYCGGTFYGGPPITPALLKLDPRWDPLRGDPAFQKLCQEKQE